MLNLECVFFFTKIGNRILKEEIANPEAESVDKWDSFYHCAEWQNIACTNIPHAKLVYVQVSVKG